MSNDPVPEEETAAGAAGDCDHAGARPGARFCARCGEPIRAVEVEETAPEEETTEPAPRHRAQRRVPWHERNPEPEEPEEESEIPRALAWLRREEAARWARPSVRVPMRWVLPIAIGTAVILAAGTVLYFVQDTWFSPEEPARELGAALEAGDGPAVAALLGVDTEFHPLLAAGALDAGYEPVEDFVVVSVEHDVRGERVSTGDGITSRYVEDYTRRPDMENARVTVAYRLGGEEVTAELWAVREAGGWFREWRLNPAGIASTLTVSGRTTGTLTLAGIPAPEPATEEPEGDGALLALPGIYTLTAPGDDVWTDATDTVALTLGADEHAGAFAEIRPEVPRDVTALVHTHIDECAAAGGMPDGPCGFRDDSGWLFSMPEDAIWSLTSYPEVEVTSGDFGTGELAVSTTVPGGATTTYETILGDTRTIEVEVHANGIANYSSGELIFTPQTCDIDAEYC